MDQSKNDKPYFYIYIDPGEASVDDITNVFNRMSDLHRKLGGIGLEYSVDKEKNSGNFVALRVEPIEE